MIRFTRRPAATATPAAMFDPYRTPRPVVTVPAPVLPRVILPAGMTADDYSGMIMAANLATAARIRRTATRSTATGYRGGHRPNSLPNGGRAY